MTLILPVNESLHQTPARDTAHAIDSLERSVAIPALPQNRPARLLWTAAVVHR
jgi:hypothetical protein